MSRRSKPDPAEAQDIAKATQAFMLYGILPLWVVPGFVDWVYHRRSRIERTSGTHESAIHAAMMASIGLPVLAGLFLEIDAGVIAFMFGAFLVHEGLAVWDVDYASRLRTVVPNEQHCHSCLEVLPFTAMSFVTVIRARQTRALFGFGPERPRWNVRPKAEGIAPAYTAAILTAIAAFIAIPYAEELVRCYRVDRTLRSHAGAPIETGTEEKSEV
jgi:hypothetical protein